ncbi:hypothetical protein PSTG_02402 [Puccinia striiformis f. sp. tritici PST-78]|uniref:Uncharacterized protein n=1 Tax=Puccinia striiformis f. sp. tritici PST-78 TaxID=1165861 RepID=A0A0L0VZ71_9BASI|nr:hypothetical protein PSTG_02402 [Puccinia striiformis f. sp. tritici PST-78]
MPLSINFKATRGIIIVGHMAELDHDQIAQHFTPHVVSLLIDHLPEKFLPPEESTHTTIGNIRETCHVLYIQDNGRVMDALFSITKNEKKHLMETIYQTMKMLDVEVPGLRKCMPSNRVQQSFNIFNVTDRQYTDYCERSLHLGIRLLKKKITETSNNDEGLPLTQGEHDAFIKKLMARFDCEMPLYQSLSICVRIPMVSTRGDRVWIGFNAHQGPSGLMVAEDHSSKFYMNFWARSGDKPINVD